MCANYRPVTRMDRMLTFFGGERDRDTVPADVWKNGLAPMLILNTEGGPRRVVDAVFRFVPEAVSKMEWAKNTQNSRSETVSTLRTFKGAWAAGQRCIIPAEHIYEPRYYGTVEQPGTSERWAIGQDGEIPFGIAGIYRTYTDERTGEITFAMSMLTVNADGHPVMSLFHRPGKEKRMVVILDPADYEAWLTCSVDDAPRFFRQWHGELRTWPAPSDRAAPRTISGKVVQGPPQEPLL